MSNDLTARIENYLSWIPQDTAKRLAMRLLSEALTEIRRLQSQPCPHCGDKCDLRPMKSESNTESRAIDIIKEVRVK